MDGWFGYLLLAGLFFLMMRFGCGSHMAHGGAKGRGGQGCSGGHGGHKGHGDDHGVKHRDPVCGMEVEANEGYGKMYKDELHRFCSRKCLDEFDNDPERYLSEEGVKQLSEEGTKP